MPFQVDKAAEKLVPAEPKASGAATAAIFEAAGLLAGDSNEARKLDSADGAADQVSWVREGSPDCTALRFLSTGKSLQRQMQTRDQSMQHIIKEINGLLNNNI